MTDIKEALPNAEKSLKVGPGWGAMEVRDQAAIPSAYAFFLYVQFKN